MPSREDHLEVGDETDWQREERWAQRRGYDERDGPDGPPRGSSPARWLVPVLIVVALVAGAGVWAVQSGRVSWSGAGDGGDPAPVASLEGADLADPFLGTPAERYGVGEAGIEIPEATALGAYDVTRVRDVLETAKRLLVLSRLEGAMLGGDTAPFLAALAPAARAKVAPLFDAGGPEAMSYGSRLAPGQRLLATPRTSGSMRAELGPSGELLVVTSYVTVYPLVPPGPVANRGDTHVVNRADVTFAFYDTRWAPTDRGAWPVSTRGYTFHMDCEAVARGLIALSATSPTGGPAGGRDPKDYYATTTPADAEDGCPDS